MNSEKLKKYYEELAKRTLSTFVDSKYSLLQLVDKPDLQSNELDCGIEVRLCEDEYDGRADAFLRIYFSKDNEDSFMQEKLKQMKLNSWLYRDKATGALAFCAYSGLTDMNQRKKRIAEYIEEKSKKFKEYTKFNLNGLYLFCRWSFKDWDIKEIIKYITINEFNIIFFDCIDCIYKYESYSKVITRNDFTMDAYSKILDSLNMTYKLI